jgi:hypothetical protein
MSCLKAESWVCSRVDHWGGHSVEYWDESMVGKKYDLTAALKAVKTADYLACSRAAAMDVRSAVYLDCLTADQMAASTAVPMTLKMDSSTAATRLTE